MLRRGVPQPIRWALIVLMLASADTAGRRAHGQREAETTATRPNEDQPPVQNSRSKPRAQELSGDWAQGET